jgi:hypothetical protein
VLEINGSKHAWNITLSELEQADHLLDKGNHAIRIAESFELASQCSVSSRLTSTTRATW